MTEARPLDLSDPGVRRAWAALLDASPVSSPFGALDVAEAAAGAFGFTLRAFGVEADAGLVAGLLVYEKRQGPYRLGVVPPLVPVTPFVLAEVPTESEVHGRASPLDAIVGALNGRFHALAFRLQHAIADVRPWTWAGFTATPRYTYAQALGPSSEMLAASGRGVRQRIRRDGDTFTFAEEPDRLDVLEALETDVYARQDAEPPVASDRRDAYLRPLLASGRARLFVLRDAEEGAPVGAQAVVSDGRDASVVCGASRPGSAMTVMTHRVREALHDEGVRSLDLVGANLPAVAEFKRGFGMPLVAQFYVTRVDRPELRALGLVRPVV